MTLHAKIYIGIALAALLGVTVGAREWIDQHDARIKAEASVEAQKTIQAQYAQQISDLSKQLADRDFAYQVQLKALSGTFQSSTTPQQIAQLLSSVMGLKQPIEIKTIQPTVQPTVQQPNPVTTAQVPSSDFPQAKAYVEACEECKLTNAKLLADAADRETQAHLAQLQLDALKKENLALYNEAKGGTFWLRTKKAAKYIVLGAAGGVVAICVSGHCR